MPGIRRVVGLGLCGSNVSITFGKVEIPALSADYGDSLEPGKLSAMGGQQIDEITQGNYTVADITLKLSAVRFRSMLMPEMPKHGGGNVRMPIVVAYSHPDLGSDSDLLSDARVVNWATALANSNAAFEVPLKVVCRQIFWTHQRKTINQLRGTTPSGAHGF